MFELEPKIGSGCFWLLTYLSQKAKEGGRVLGGMIGPDYQGEIRLLSNGDKGSVSGM